MNQFFSAEPGDSTGIRFFEASKRRHLDASPRDGWLVPSLGTDMMTRGSPVESHTSLADTLHARNSFREFAAATLTEQQLRAALDLLAPQLVGSEGIERGSRYRGPYRPGSALAYVSAELLVARVDGWQPGHYAYDFCAGQASLRKPMDIRQFLSGNVVQPETIEAPALLVLVGHLADCLRTHGNRGYRYMLFEAGMLMQRIYLGLASQGLGGAPNGSAMHRNFDTLLQFDGYRKTTINVFAFGSPNR